MKWTTGGDSNDPGLDKRVFDAQGQGRPRRKSRKPWLTRSLSFILAPALLGGMIGIPPAFGIKTAFGIATDYWDSLPSEESLDVPLPGHTTVYTSDGQLMATFFEENRVPLTRDEIPQSVVDALVATEDAAFFSHGGIDLKGIARSLVQQASGNPQGGSTITAQLVQNLDGLRGRGTSGKVSERSVELKLEEFKRAVTLEREYSKDDILTAYLNTVYFGNGAYGLGAAAWTYFGKDAADLTVPQAALLVGLLKGPSAYDPIKNEEKATTRRNVVLGRMVEVGYLTKDEAADMAETPLDLDVHSSQRGCDESPWPYYCTMVLSELKNNEAFGETESERRARYVSGEMTLTVAASSTDLDTAQQSVIDIMGVDNPYKAALAVVEPGTGGVLAIAQNTTWPDTEIVLADAAQQVGSSFKPITLAAALEEGFTLDQTFDGTAPYRSVLDNPTSGAFSNADGAHGGVMDAREAMRISNNIYFIKLTEKVGVKNVASMANRLGLDLPTNLTGREASITLGAYESTPLEMATVYATFASGGITCDPVFIVDVVDNRTGESLPAPDPNCRRTLDGKVSDDVVEALKLPLMEGGTAGGAGDVGRPVIGKTGSTNNWTVAWFAGAAPQEASAMWIADPTGPNSHPLRRVRTSFGTIPNGYAGALAAPAWVRVMREMMDGKDIEDFTTGGPSGTFVMDIVPDLRGLDLDGAIMTAFSQGYSVIVSPEHLALSPFGPGVVSRVDVEDHVLTLATTDGTDTLPYEGYLWRLSDEGAVQGIETE